MCTDEKGQKKTGPRFANIGKNVTLWTPGNSWLIGKSLGDSLSDVESKKKWHVYENFCPVGIGVLVLCMVDC